MNQMVILNISINFSICIACNFVEDVFHIDEVTIYENKYSDNKYALAGDTLDAVSSIIFLMCFILAPWKRNWIMYLVGMLNKFKCLTYELNTIGSVYLGMECTK